MTHAILKRQNAGAILWAVSLQYYITQLVVAGFWHTPGYSWFKNTISDLGNTQCGPYRSGVVCSPLHPLMNASFVVLGVTMIFGAVLLSRSLQARSTRMGFAGFYSMAAAGVGAILVGLFPENTVSGFHILGAALSFVFGNAGMLLVSLALTKIPRWLRRYGAVSGMVGLLALVFWTLHVYVGLGIGGMERVVGYLQSIWMIVFGAHLLAHESARQKSIKN